MADIRKLKDGRYQVIRSDGARLSLEYESWQQVITDIERVHFGIGMPKPHRASTYLDMVNESHN